VLPRSVRGIAEKDQVVNAQAKISEAAIERASAVRPDEVVRFMVALTEPWFTDEEVAFMRDNLGMTYFMRTCRLARVGIPARHLLTLAEMGPVIHVG
jgi:hypothetical protein